MDNTLSFLIGLDIGMAIPICMHFMQKWIDKRRMLSQLEELADEIGKLSPEELAEQYAE